MTSAVADPGTALESKQLAVTQLRSLRASARGPNAHLRALEPWGCSEARLGSTTSDISNSQVAAAKGRHLAILCCLPCCTSAQRMAAGHDAVTALLLCECKALMHQRCRYAARRRLRT